MKAKILSRSGTTAEWAAEQDTLVLGPGEWGINLDNPSLSKVGNGSTIYKDLPTLRDIFGTNDPYPANMPVEISVGGIQVGDRLDNLSAIEILQKMFTQPEVVIPYFATMGSDEEMPVLTELEPTKEQLEGDPYKIFLIAFGASGNGMGSVEFPVEWGTPYGCKIWNELAQVYEWQGASDGARSLEFWDHSVISKNIAGVDVQYNKFVYSDAVRGAQNIEFYLES